MVWNRSIEGRIWQMAFNDYNNLEVQLALMPRAQRIAPPGTDFVPIIFETGAVRPTLSHNFWNGFKRGLFGGPVEYQGELDDLSGPFKGRGPSLSQMLQVGQYLRAHVERPRNDQYYRVTHIYEHGW